jgi:hypothetical protein
MQDDATVSDQQQTIEPGHFENANMRDETTGTEAGLTPQCSMQELARLYLAFDRHLGVAPRNDGHRIISGFHGVRLVNEAHFTEVKVMLIRKPMDLTRIPDQDGLDNPTFLGFTSRSQDLGFLRCRYRYQNWSCSSGCL